MQLERVSVSWFQHLTCLSYGRKIKLSSRPGHENGLSIYYDVVDLAELAFIHNILRPTQNFYYFAGNFKYIFVNDNCCTSLSEPMMPTVQTHICVTRPHWFQGPCDACLMSMVIQYHHNCTSTMSIFSDWIILPAPVSDGLSEMKYSPCSVVVQT